MAGALTAAIAAAFSGGAAAATDPYFEYTTLLLPGSGTNGAQNNTFLDGSTNNFTITRNGNTTQGTFSPFSQTGWGGAFNTSTTYLTVTDTVNLRFGSSNFTIEAWVYRNASGATQTIASKGASTPTGWVFQISSADKLVFTDTSTSITGTTSIAANTWTYVAVVRAGTGANQTTLYVNGTSDGTGTSATNFNQTSNMLIGADRSTTNFANGYISNLRLSNTNRTISSTPTTALTADANTIFLSLNLNRFQYTDSTAAYTNISVTGTPSVVAFSPFNPTASWSAATYGGSGYFDGSGDYLSNATSTSALTFGTGDFTIEGWVYSSDVTNEKGVCQLSDTSGGLKPTATGVISIVTRSSVVRVVNAGTATNGTIGITTNQWFHFALVRSSGTTNLYVNGVKDTGFGDKADSTNYATTYIAIGGAESTAYLTVGYITNLRVVKGTAVYTGAFTSPTAPITNAGSTSAASYPSTTNVNTSFASSATSLLLNFTNAGIYDATSKNDLETVGNAQISNTTANWGSTSIKFDGTGDYLTNNNASNSLLAFGTGDFTIEGWFYSNNASSVEQRGMFQTSDTIGGLKTSYTTGIIMTHGSTGNLNVNVGGTLYSTQGASITTGAWFYFAITRSSGNVNVYVNGVSRASGSGDTNNLTGTYICVGGYYSTSYLFDGYLQDFRITKGYARTITASPTAAFLTL